MSISRHQAVGAYRRWTPADFDAKADGARGDDAEAQAANALDAPAPPPPPPSPAAAPEVPQLPPDFRLPTAEEIERMHEEVRRAGFEEGRREGLAEGLEAGRRQGYEEGHALAAAEAARVAQLVAALEDAMQTLDAEVAEEVMALAIEMARRIVRVTLEHHPESILDTVREALLQLPQGHAQIHLHPEDLDLVRRNAGDQFAHGGHRLHEDLRLQRGECRVEGQGTLVDATLQTRWRRVLESIGHEKAAWATTDTAGLAADDADGAPQPPLQPEPDDGNSTALPPPDDEDAVQRPRATGTESPGA